MQGLPPRTLSQRLWDENVPRVPVALWFMFLPMIVLGLVTLLWGVLYAVGITKVGDEGFIVFGVVNLLSVVAAWVFFTESERLSLRSWVTVCARWQLWKAGTRPRTMTLETG